MIDGFCQKEIFYLILKYECFMSKDSVDLIINHLKSLKLSHAEYMEMERTIDDEEIISKLQSIVVIIYLLISILNSSNNCIFFLFSKRIYISHK